MPNANFEMIDRREHRLYQRPCCLLEGTRVLTPSGPRTVEDLAVGDELCTAQNDVLPLRWVGRSTIHTRFADPLAVMPVCIKTGALGNALPGRDLWLSPDHAVFLDGILVQAAALVNGATIYREQEMPGEFTYYHLELATHELLLAEDAAVESFMDNARRWQFDNAEQYAALGPAAIEEMPYPRASSAGQVPGALKIPA
jgi:Hint domain